MPKPPRILLVDDREENLLALEALLRDEKAELVRARSGTEALELLLASEFALAIVDVQMPEMDGIELAELMRGTVRTREVPIILVTAGLHDEARVFRGYELGAVDFLHKPLDPVVLRSKVAVFLQLHRQRQLLSEQLDEIRRAKQALQESDRRKDEFLAVLSHELRNPLAPIQNGIYILRRAMPQDERAARAVEVIERQARHLERLVSDLLDVTRIARGKVQLQRQRLDLADALRRTADDHRPDFAAKRVEFQVTTPPGPVWVDADPTRLAQIVGNLLVNALKFTDAGRSVSLALALDGRSAAIVVADEGAGIAPQLLPVIFDPFTQADRTLARSQGGLGLGLALVKGMVELHGGDVSATSRGPGQGATFRVRLPLALGPVASAGAAAPSVRPRGVALRVLVVEDNADAASTLREALELLGHEVHVASDGDAGVAAAERIAPDVVVCDIGLPGIDGYEVARRLSARDGARPLLVAVTGYALPEDRRRALEAGFVQHLAKPLRIEDLERVIGSAGARVGGESPAAQA
jgi:signal transduction histidine kinase